MVFEAHIAPISLGYKPIYQPQVDTIEMIPRTFLQYYGIACTSVLTGWFNLNGIVVWSLWLVI